MQKYEKKTKETCQNEKKKSVKTEKCLSKRKNVCQNGKKRVLRAVFTVFSTFLRCFPFFGYSFSSAFDIFSKRYFLGLIPLNFANWR